MTESEFNNLKIGTKLLCVEQCQGISLNGDICEIIDISYGGNSTMLKLRNASCSGFVSSYLFKSEVKMCFKNYLLEERKNKIELIKKRING